MKIYRKIDETLVEAEVVISASTAQEIDGIEHKLTEKLSILTVDGLVFLSKMEILFVKSDKNYLMVETFDESYKVRATLYSYEKKFPDFVKISRSCLINVENLTNVKTDLIFGLLAQVGNQKIPVSRSYLPQLNAKILEMEEKNAHD